MTVREKIITEMGKQIEMKSIKVITMDEIAQNVGISKRTLYEIFPSKESLIKEVLIAFIQKVREMVEEIIDGNDNIFVKMLKIIYLKHQMLEKIRFERITEIRKTYTGLFNEIFDKTAWKDGKYDGYKFFQMAIQEGFIMEKINVDFIISMIDLNMRNAMTDVYLKENCFYPVKTIAILHIIIIIRGISTLKGIEIIDEFTSKIKDINNIEINK
ncbi:MAG: TetR/AcrR family transcriptional regulator [Bacteroidales bacterium]|jgi:AcrR family transcriptional regulator|nr:TetR/AcrR family transcriptional regulator [Bacteroidales bacterium]